MMSKPFFTIIVVSYNAGERIERTLESIMTQSFDGFDVLIKDGMSTDGSVEKIKDKYGIDSSGVSSDKKITLIESCDNGIYHAMNIAVSHLGERALEVKAGETPSYIFFLNCGDLFRDRDVLKNVHRFICERDAREGTTVPAIYYGDIFDVSAGAKVPSNPRIDDYACYRNVPSHQACFYDERLMYRNPFNLQFQVRADYEQFLRCFYKEKADAVYRPLIVADYEGGGFSAQNRKISE
ncbi:MAG: glycosyltransferase, partial [Lachnospiraceae bacterium]|nr:glycosyltransferase [Lachnospiraceae bacterium]